MTYLQSFNMRTRRPVALALAVTLGGLGGIAAGKAQAADIPVYNPPQAAPYVEQRVQSGFSHVGPYVGVRGGFGMADDTDFTIGLGRVTNEYEDWNLTGSGFVGYEAQFFPGFGGRLEGELGLSSFEVENHRLGGAVQAGSTGETSALFGAVNAYVDADLGLFRPFAGVGIGMASVDFDNHGTTGLGTVMNDDDTAFLWQVSGGVGYQMTDQITLEGMVRYQSIMDVELTSTAAGGSLGSSTDLNSTSALVGLRYRF